jgi:predicted nucleic acid-binding protein
MTILALEQSLQSGDRVLVDTTTLIGYLDGSERITPLASHVMNEMVSTGRNPAVLSMISIAEVLVRPMRAGVLEQYDHLLDFLTKFPNLRPIPVDLAVAQEAASLRASYRLAMADALIVATGIVSQVHHLVTNDADWSRKLQPISGRIRVCHLSRFL